MSEAINKLKELNIYPSGQKLCKEDIILIQRYLKRTKNAFLPSEYIEFIKNHNSFSYMGGHIFGIFNKNTFINNIYYENANQDIENVVFLGRNEFDYLVFNCILNKYQILDIHSLEILEEYLDFDNSFFYIIKL